MPASTHYYADMSSPISPRSASSWADTDMDTDSENEYGQFTFFREDQDNNSDKHNDADRHHLQQHSGAALKRKALSKNMCARTAPITIPQTSKRRTTRTSSFEELEQQEDTEITAMAYEHTFGAMELDDDDEDHPALYSNCGYFRSQHGNVQGAAHPFHRSYGQRSPSPRTQVQSSAQPVSAEDDDIFAMDL